MIDINTEDVEQLKQACESLAYLVLHYQNPTWHSIPDEEIESLLREEGLDVSLWI